MYSIPSMADELEQLIVLMRVKLPTASFDQCRQLARYLNYVVEYSAVLNLTGLRDLGEMADGLVEEALKLLELADIDADWQAIDLGSGNGSPVVPLALLCSEAHFHAIEARERRAAFLSAVRAGLHLANLTVHHARVEEIVVAQPEAFDLVTSRAFAPPERLLPLAVQLMRDGGEVRGFTGADLAPLMEAARQCGLTVEKTLRYTQHGEARHVYLLRLGAAAPPPPRQAVY
jgi:16S rRNA (guanine527-N7)-methyltransferase